MSFLFSFLACLCSLIVITSTSPVTSVIYLITTFIIASIYLALNSIVYISLTYIIVYVGAVIVLFLFVIMMINLDQTIMIAESNRSLVHHYLKNNDHDREKGADKIFPSCLREDGAIIFTGGAALAVVATVMFIYVVDINIYPVSQFVNSINLFAPSHVSISAIDMFHSSSEIINNYQQIQFVGIILYSSKGL